MKERGEEMNEKTDTGGALQVPKILHELFGRRTTKAEMTIVLASCIILSSFLLFHTYSEWSGFAAWKKAVLIIITQDITGGVSANVTKGTNTYYQASRTARLVFLGVHIQPLILGWLFGNLLLATGCMDLHHCICMLHHQYQGRRNSAYRWDVISVDGSRYSNLGGGSPRSPKCAARFIYIQTCLQLCG